MSLWTVQQHEWLEALGHPVLLLAGDPALVVAAPIVPVVPRPVPQTAHQSGAASAASQRAKPVARDEPVSRVVPPGKAGADDDIGIKKVPGSIRPRADVAAKKAALDEARRASRPAASGSPQEDVLLAAVGRATGMEAPAVRQAMATLAVDPEKLRTSSGAKRALWLQLRRQRGERNR